ncbi:MAG: prepilin peptidase [Clostridium sp.]
MFTTPLIILPIVFLFGITVGSFLNVCIYRLPLGEDIVHTDSHCMSCGHQLAWYDLIPVFSWLFLRGRCRSCGEKISVQYPAIELFNGLIWTGLIDTMGFSATGICYCIAASALLVLSVIDWRTYEIPVGCNLVILAAGIANLFFHKEAWISFGIGLICVSGLLLLILLVSRGRAMGGGDVKLMAAAGLLLGWQGIILAFGVGCIAGSVIHVGLMKVKGKERLLAFGPYLSLGIWFSMMWGAKLIDWYMGQF